MHVTHDNFCSYIDPFRIKRKFKKKQAGVVPTIGNKGKFRRSKKAERKRMTRIKNLKRQQEERLAKMGITKEDLEKIAQMEVDA